MNVLELISWCRESQRSSCPCWSFSNWCPPSSSVKPSPSKKSRGGGQGGLRRAPTLGAPTPLSHSTGQSGVDSRVVYYSHFKSTDSEADSGKNWDQQSDRTLSRSIFNCVHNHNFTQSWEQSGDTGVEMSNNLVLLKLAFRGADGQTRSCSEDPPAGRKPCWLWSQPVCLLTRQHRSCLHFSSPAVKHHQENFYDI